MGRIVVELNCNVVKTEIQIDLKSLKIIKLTQTLSFICQKAFKSGFIRTNAPNI